MAASIRASREGLLLVDQARRKKGWSKTEQAWIDLASTSRATLRRFWTGSAIQSQAFAEICQVVGISDWKSIADLQVTTEAEGVENNRRKQVTLVLSIDSCSLDEAKLQQIIAEFISLGGNQSIELMDIDEG